MVIAVAYDKAGVFRREHFYVAFTPVVPPTTYRAIGMMVSMVAPPVRPGIRFNPRRWAT